MGTRHPTTASTVGGLFCATPRGLLATSLLDHALLTLWLALLLLALGNPVAADSVTVTGRAAPPASRRERLEERAARDARNRSVGDRAADVERFQQPQRVAAVVADGR